MYPGVATYNMYNTPTSPIRANPGYTAYGTGPVRPPSRVGLTPQLSNRPLYDVHVGLNAEASARLDPTIQGKQSYYHIMPAQPPVNAYLIPTNISQSAMLAQIKPSSFHPVGQSEGHYEPVSLVDALQKYASYAHVAHSMYYSRPQPTITEPYPPPANILMVMESRGRFTFPGGHLEPFDDSISDGLNRELREEINISRRYESTQSDYLFSNVNHATRHVGHFYAHEVSDPELVQIAGQIVDAKHWGIEVFGVMILPLSSQDSGPQGFPAFLADKFFPVSRTCLISAIQMLHLMSPAQLSQLLSRSNNYSQSR